MENITIKITIDEADLLYQLVRESTNTGNEEWDETMKSIEEKIYSKL